MRMTPLDSLFRLEAQEDIRRLKARYFRCVDTKDWPGFEALLTPDVVLERTFSSSVLDPWTGQWRPPIADAPQRVVGRDAVMAAVRKAVGAVRSVHHGFMPEIDILGPDEARGVWAMSDELRDRQGRLIFRGAGHYHETYRRLPSGWAISTFRLTRLALEHGDGER
jgi:hypothetical protein